MPRRITEYDKERFTCGDCLILAEELSKATGYPVYALRTEWADGPMLHAFVLTPDRKALDVTGVVSLREMVRKWDACGYVKGAWKPTWPEQFSGSRRRARQIVPLLTALIDN